MILPKLSNREKYFLYITVGIAIFVVADRLIFLPISSVMDNLNKQISIYEKKVGSSMIVLRQEDEITNKYKINMKSLKKISSNEEEMATLSSEIEQLARKTSIVVKNMKPLKAEESDLYTEYKVDLEAEAEMPYLMDFIYQLEKSPQVLKVNSLSLTRKKKETANLNISILITKILFH